MPVNLSIKNVPDDVADKLRKRAKRNRRSLQGELLHLLEESLTREAMSTKRISFEEFDRKMAGIEFNTPGGPVAARRLSPAELHARVSKQGLKTAGDSVEIIRADRDSR